LGKPKDRATPCSWENETTLEIAGKLANQTPMVLRLGYSGRQSRERLPCRTVRPPADKRQTDMQSTTTERYKLPVRFGLGSVPLGNEFAVTAKRSLMPRSKPRGARVSAITTPRPGLGSAYASVGSAVSCTPRTGRSLSSPPKWESCSRRRGRITRRRIFPSRHLS
jgi:hypothetical protein